MVTVMGYTPGVARLDTGTLALSEAELAKVVGAGIPLNATVDLAVNPAPVTPIVVSVLIGPPVRLMAANVGTGGLVIETGNGMESGGVAAGVLTVTFAVATVTREAAGTVANM